MLPEIFHLPTYWLINLLGTGAAITGIAWLAPRHGLRRQEMGWLAVAISLLGWCVGAPLFFTIQHLTWLKSHWWYSPTAHLSSLGTVVYGGILVGWLGVAGYARFRRLSIARVSDLFFPWVALAQGIGRIGCFLAGCCYGKPTHVPWGMTFPFTRTPVHPTQLYEAAFMLAFGGWLLWRSSRRRFEGEVTCLYLMGYGGFRFLIEFLRGDQAIYGLGLTFSQWLSLVLMVSSVGWLIRQRRRTVSLPRPVAQAG